MGQHYFMIIAALKSSRDFNAPNLVESTTFGGSSEKVITGTEDANEVPSAIVTNTVIFWRNSEKGEANLKEFDLEREERCEKTIIQSALTEIVIDHEEYMQLYVSKLKHMNVFKYGNSISKWNSIM